MGSNMFRKMMDGDGRDQSTHVQKNMYLLYVFIMYIYIIII